MSEDAGCAERLPCALFATVVKPISDLRLLISGLCAMLCALSFLALCSLRLAFLLRRYALCADKRAQLKPERKARYGYYVWISFSNG
jgi:hypothetical protein